DVLNDQQIACNFCPTTFIDNAGLFRKSGGTGTTVVGTILDNTGTVDVQTGWISFGQGSAFHTGTVFTGAGTNLLASGTVTFDGAIVSANAELAGANLIGIGTISGTLNWTSGTVGSSGAVSIATNGVLNISGPGSKSIFGVLTNAGTVRWTAGDLVL